MQWTIWTTLRITKYCRTEGKSITEGMNNQPYCWDDCLCRVTMEMKMLMNMCWLIWNAFDFMLVKFVMPVRMFFNGCLVLFKWCIAKYLLLTLVVLNKFAVNFIVESFVLFLVVFFFMVGFSISASLFKYLESLI